MLGQFGLRDDYGRRWSHTSLWNFLARTARKITGHTLFDRKLESTFSTRKEQYAYISVQKWFICCWANICWFIDESLFFYVARAPIVLSYRNVISALAFVLLPKLVFIWTNIERWMMATVFGPDMGHYWILSRPLFGRYVPINHSRYLSRYFETTPLTAN